MDIIEQIIRKEISETARRRLRLIKRFPQIYSLLLNFHQEVSLLKPKNETETINKVKLREIVFTAISKMSAEINSISYKKPTTVVFEMLLRIQEQLIKTFKNKGSELKLLLSKMSQQYCKQMLDDNDSFVFILSNRLKAIEIEEKKKSEQSKIVKIRSKLFCIYIS